MFDHPPLVWAVAAILVVFSVRFLFETRALRTVFLVWVMGLLASSFLLMTGAEVLALFLACFCTVHAVLSVSHSIGFGLRRSWDELSARKRWSSVLVFLGLFCVVGHFALKGGWDKAGSVSEVDLRELGLQMIEPMLIPSVILAIIGVSYLLGLGVISRAEKEYE